MKEIIKIIRWTLFTVTYVAYQVLVAASDILLNAVCGIARIITGIKRDAAESRLYYMQNLCIRMNGIENISYVKVEEKAEQN